MAVDLIYKHQQRTYALMQAELKRSKRAAYEFPTGCGKTFPALKHIEANPNKTVLIISPSTAINSQFKRHIETYVENGKERISNKNIVIVTYQKVALLAKKVKNLRADIIIIDELHRMGAETWEPAIDELIETQPEAEVIAMTATPRRTDKRNMAEEKFGDHIVYEMSLTEALSGEKEGEVVLKSPRYVRVLSQLMSQISEYKESISYIEDEEKRQRLLKKYERLESTVNNSPDIQDVMVAGMQKKNGKYIVFCKDREDMIEKMAQAQEIFGKVNSKIQAEYVISKNGKGDVFGKSEAQNRRTLERFEVAETTDALQLLFCVDKLNEGVHIDGIDGEVLFDFTRSPVLYKQRIGRITSPNGETVIIDAVNNWINQIDTYYELENAIRKGQTNGKEKDKEKQGYDLLKLSPEETELLEILREIGEEFKYNDNKTYEQVIEWLEVHNGKLPQTYSWKKRVEITEQEKKEAQLYGRWYYSQERKVLYEYVGRAIEEVPEEYREKIAKLRAYGLGLEEKTTYQQIIEWLQAHNGKLPEAYANKKRVEITEQEKKEAQLCNRWYHSQERKILYEYVGRAIEEVPEEYREKIATLRAYGLGLEERTTYQQIIEWLKAHNGKLPEAYAGKKRAEITEQEKKEAQLYVRWRFSQERKILDEHAGRPIEEVPEEYREKIVNLREYGLGLVGLEERTTYQQIIEWLATHDGNMPRIFGRKKVNELTEEEREERNLYQRWNYSFERKILEEYAGRPLKEVPEEYREKIARLREYGLGLVGLEERTTYQQIIEWLETHDGNMPRGFSSKKVSELTEEEREERKLCGRWHNASERKILNKYAGRPLEEVPEEYREKIATLRAYGLEEKTAYEEIIEWLETHDGKMPRGFSSKKVSKMTEEEREERSLYARWQYSSERKILNKYAGRPIEEVPEEYREKIAKLRSLGQLGIKKDDQIKGRMKKAVGKAVGENGTTREELGEIKRY